MSGTQSGAIATPAPATGANPFQIASQGMQGAGGVYKDIAAPGALRLSMNQFINPYQTAVIDQTQKRIIDQRDQDLSKIGGDAAMAGAYGGSRHGLLESTVYDNANRNVGEMSNTMMREGWDTAAGLGQTDIGNRMAGAQGLQGLATQYMGVGGNITDRQSANGQQGQQLGQAILSQGNGQFDAKMGYPQQQLNSMLGAISGSPLSGNQTQSYKPGMLDWASLGTQGASAWLSGKGG